jgi:hypothetical protein
MLARKQPSSRQASQTGADDRHPQPRPRACKPGRLFLIV